MKRGRELDVTGSIAVETRVAWDAQVDCREV